MNHVTTILLLGNQQVGKSRLAHCIQKAAVRHNPQPDTYEQEAAFVEEESGIPSAFVGKDGTLGFEPISLMNEQSASGQFSASSQCASNTEDGSNCDDLFSDMLASESDLKKSYSCEANSRLHDIGMRGGLVQVLDTTADEKCKGEMRSLYPHADIFAIICSAKDRSSLTSVKQWHSDTHLYGSTYASNESNPLGTRFSTWMRCASPPATTSNDRFHHSRAVMIVTHMDGTSVQEMFCIRYKALKLAICENIPYGEVSCDPRKERASVSTVAELIREAASEHKADMHARSQPSFTVQQSHCCFTGPCGSEKNDGWTAAKRDQPHETHLVDALPNSCPAWPTQWNRYVCRLVNPSIWTTETHQAFDESFRNWLDILARSLHAFHLGFILPTLAQFLAPVSRGYSVNAHETLAHLSYHWTTRGYLLPEGPPCMSQRCHKIEDQDQISQEEHEAREMAQLRIIRCRLRRPQNRTMDSKQTKRAQARARSSSGSKHRSVLCCLGYQSQEDTIATTAPDRDLSSVSTWTASSGVSTRERSTPSEKMVCCSIS